MLRRRRYFIKKKFQTNFLVRFIILLLLESLLIAGLFMYVSSDTLTTGYFNSTLKIDRTVNFFFISFLLITLIAVVGVGIAGLIIFILLSHRIAGPLYRFEKTLERIGNGDLTTRIDLRGTDQLTELKEALNTLADSLDRRMAGIKNSLAEAQNLLAKKDDPEFNVKLKKILTHLKDEIEYFKVTSTSKD